MQEDVVVDGVESSTHVKQAKQSYLMTLIKVVSVKCSSRYADWSGGIEFESTRCFFFICSATIRSITFEMIAQYEIGR